MPDGATSRLVDPEQRAHLRRRANQFNELARRTPTGPVAFRAHCSRNASGSDLFAITGGCDREAVIFGTSVTGDTDHGDSAKATLSSGATLGLQRSGGKWYVSSISGGSPQHIKQGLCAGAAGA